MKEYKCKKCGLTYDRKYKACPYCKKPRPKTGLVIFLIILILGAVGAFYYTNNGNPLNSKVKYLDGLKLEITSIEDVKGSLLNYNYIDCNIDITNTTTTDKTLTCSIKAYVDDYETSVDWFFSNTSLYTESLVAGKKISKSISIDVDNPDWKKIELFYSLDDENYQRLYTITHNDITEETH